MPEANHPIWRILSIAVVGIVLVAMLTFNYENGWSPKDYLTLIAVLLGQGIADSVASVMGRKGGTE